MQKKWGKDYDPVKIAYELGYPDYILNAIKKAKDEHEVEKILVDARKENFKKYKPYNETKTNFQRR